MDSRCRGPLLWAGLALAAGLAATACSPRHDTPAARPSSPLTSPLSAGRTASTTGVPAPPWQPNPEAVAVAERYVISALSYRWTDPPSEWIQRLAPWCTPQWRAQLLSSADGGAGGWTTVVAERASAYARVLAVYPSAGPGPGHRLEVTATVVRSAFGSPPRTGTAAVAVDVVAQPGGGWLIGWAG